MRNDRRAAAAALIVGVFASLPGSAIAHDADVGPNGGPMVESKGHHLELLAQGGDLVVVLSDAGHAPVASSGASGRAVILEGSAQRSVALAPAAPDKLAAKLEKPLESGARVVVSAKLGSGQDLLARFVLK